jgi:signal transduction histidine kinase
LRVLRSPITLFLVIGLVTVGAIVVGTNELSDRAASDEAIAEASTVTELLAETVMGPLVPKGLVYLRDDNLPKHQRALEALDFEVQSRLVNVDNARRVNIWRLAGRPAAADEPAGRLIYSSDAEAIVESFAHPEDYRLSLSPSQRSVLQHGGDGSEIIESDGTVRIYTRMESPEGKPLLFEAYFTPQEISQRQGEIFSSFRWITLGSLLLLILLATAILVGLTRELRRSAQERERLLLSAIDASDAERRRIARDLHDSVVQDLAGTAFAVSAVARSPETSDDSRETLEGAGTSLRTSLKSLRSLLAEIHPPDLHAVGLAAALSDLIAPAAAVGVQASVSVEGAETMSTERSALVWRVAQEAVRNALRHSGASTLAVTVHSDGKRLALEVVDDGVGFDPAGVRDQESYGLRGLRSLVSDSGGTLEVRSSPGEGTTVRMEVDAQ